MKKLRIFNLVQPASSLGNNILEQFEFGHTSIIDMSTEANDLTLGLKGYFETSERFKVIPETAGAIKVVLAGHEDDNTVFTITAAQVTAYLGKPMPFLISKVIKSGTTATFSLVW